MAKVIRTLDFLPEIFQTPSNQQFLSATLDQLVNPPDLQKLQGFVGNRFGYGVNANDYYVTEPDATRTNYQLDPGVVFTKPGTSTATDFISYPGILNAINAAGGLANNNSRLFNSQFYSWDSFTNLDPLINFNQYYWLPEGPPAVTVAAATVFSAEDYVVTAEANGYNISVLGSDTGSINPTITLLRGGVYNFYVNQSTQFWIQGLPGVQGIDPTNPNQSVRQIYGVGNNGAETGIVTFTVPPANAQQQYILPGNNLVSLVSNIPYENLNGQLVSTIKNIDGVTSLNGMTVMFYDTGTPVNTNFYKIAYVGDPNNPTISLSVVSAIPVNQNINVVYGNTYGGLTFYLDNSNNIEQLPYISAPLDTLYYQDGSDPTRVGMIRLIESNVTNQLDINTQVLGQKNFTSTNGVVFTNGLKVQFNGDVVPSSYLTGQYYVQGVGTAIELLPVSDFIVSEPFTGDVLTPWDSTNWDIGNFSDTLYIPTYPDYITIARNSINRNPWSRSNRWFHIDVINATAQYNNDPSIATTFARQDNKAARPIIEFYPNLELFNYGSVGVSAVDFIDFRTTDCLNLVAGQPVYYPDVDVYTAYNANVFNPPVPTVGFTTPSPMGSINVANMRAVAISPTGVYVAVGYGTANSALYSVSTDGINWTTPELAVP